MKSNSFADTTTFIVDRSINKMWTISSLWSRQWTTSSILLILVVSPFIVDGFVVTNPITSQPIQNHQLSTTIASSTSSSSSETMMEFTEQQQNQQKTLSVTLEKPLGMILEENVERQAQGVYVLELTDDGSAIQSDYKDQLVGMSLTKITDQDVTSMDFDSIMEQLISATSPVTLEFMSKEQDTATTLTTKQDDEYEIGTIVTIKVLEDSKETIIEGKVGDNLRKTLLENNIEVYKGLKKKLGNCGGAGQCTFCAVEFVDDSQGWLERSEYEDQKLKNASPKARLSCLNNIQGPATIRL